MPTLHLPHKKYSMWNNQPKIYSNCDKRLAELASIPDTQAYYTAKYNWHTHPFHSINWEATSHAMRNVTSPTRVWISKLACGFAPIGNMQSLRKYWNDSLCPRCGTMEETTPHLLTCTDPVCIELFNTSITTLTAWFQKTQTDPILADDIIMGLQVWRQHPHNPHTILVTEAAKQQSTLGWSHMLL